MSPAAEGPRSWAGPGPAGDDGSGEEPLRPTTPTTVGLTRAVSWMAAGQVLSQLSWFASLIALGALLPTGAFGTVAVGMTITGVASLLMEAGTYGSIVATPRLGRNEIRAAASVNVGVGAALTVVAVTLAGVVAQGFAQGADPAVLRVLALTILLSSLGVVPIALLIKTMRFRRYATIATVASAAAAVVAVVAGVTGAGIWALVVRQVIYQVLIAGLCWWSVRDVVRSAEPSAPEAPEPRRRESRWFVLLASADFVAFNADYLIVGRSAGVARLGLYSLAFTIAFAPLKQFAWQIGAVFLSSAANAEDPEQAGRQALKVLRVTTLLLVPILAPAVALAPVVIPGVLGQRWSGMVFPFQVLIVVGIGHAVLNGLGEFLSGTGNVAFRAKVSVAWAAAMIATLAALVSWYGIDGAAVAHAVVFIPLAAVYWFRGLALLRVDRREARATMRPVVVLAAGQAVTTAAVVVVMDRTGVGAAVTAVTAASVGLVVAGVLLVRGGHGLWGEVRTLLGALRLRGVRPPDVDPAA